MHTLSIITIVLLTVLLLVSIVQFIVKGKGWTPLRRKQQSVTMLWCALAVLAGWLRYAHWADWLTLLLDVAIIALIVYSLILQAPPDSKNSTPL